MFIYILKIYNNFVYDFLLVELFFQQYIASQKHTLGNFTHTVVFILLNDYACIGVIFMC